MMITLRLGASDSDIALAGEIIRGGGLVAFPTETVYGLGANALDGAAVLKIFRAKNRPADNPLITHIADFSEIYALAAEVSPTAEMLAERFWPGPLTIVLPKTYVVPVEISAGLSTVSIRIPSHPVALALIRAAKTPIAAPSANSSSRPSPTSAAHVLADMEGKIDAVIDGGACGIGVESTVLSLVGEVPRLLRPGGVTLEELQKVLGEIEVDRAVREQIGETERVSAPGMKYRHYAPKAPVVSVCGTPENSANFIRESASNTDGIICFDEFVPLFSSAHIRQIGSKDDPGAQARKLFDALRSFDETDVGKIFAQCPDEKGIGLAVANRLKKASGFNIIHV